MTEKRYYAHKHLLHENEVHDKRCHNFMGLDETVEHMNNEYWKYKQLKEENEQLKLISNHRGEMVSFATSLIQDMGSEEMLKMWNDFTEIMYQKWKKKRGIK